MLSVMTSAADDSRRRELGAFLRSRRERLAPGDVGLAPGFRRRTPGLRREETAALSGVGTTWYTWLEQGRDVRPSAEVLSALAKALRLDPAETAHLFHLAGRAAPENSLRGRPECVSEPLARMLKSMDHHPAYITGRRWDVLAWNDAACAIFGDYGALGPDERNIMHLIFAHPPHRSLLGDWEELARAALGLFRADSARHVGDPDFERLIQTLSRKSAEFRQWWPQRDVAHKLFGVKRILHPVAGAMAFEHTRFSIEDGSDMRLVVYTPLAAENTIAKLDALINPARPAKRAAGRMR
ncbi:helix-turn-helix transcriptional regulator [Terrarubrum flagellatum]|uniref:helix-turn-helix transcriptional regulator n=1 Tax=Terrirubrum flagellatum TaxID=2895980 RepID=UPI0031454B1F